MNGSSEENLSDHFLSHGVKRHIPFAPNAMLHDNSLIDVDADARPTLRAYADPRRLSDVLADSFSPALMVASRIQKASRDA